MEDVDTIYAGAAELAREGLDTPNFALLKLEATSSEFFQPGWS